MPKISKIIAAPITQTINLEALSSHICIEAVSQELVDSASNIGLTLLDKALKIVNITKAFTILVAISPTKPLIGSINVHKYNAIVIGIKPIGFFSALSISSSIFDSNHLYQIGNQTKILAWYDNEWGFSKRMIELSLYIKEISAVSLKETA